jgi:hypothetical protein
MRQSDQEIDYDKFKINNSKPSLVKGAVEEIGIGTDGLITTEVNSPACLAKTVKNIDTNSTRYFVKFSNVGPTSGTMVDPEENDLSRRGDWTAKGMFTFRAVNKAAYDFYVRFVQTKNKAYYHQAAREMQ